MSLKIVEYGKSNYHIVNSYFSDECERFASSELQKYIYQSTNVFVPYFSDICPKRGPEIIIGKNARDIILDNEINLLSDDGFIIKTVGENLVISGRTSRGTLYGVYRFLEIYLGFKCFTKDVEKTDEKTDLIIDEINLTENPDFKYRDAYFRGAFDGGFASKNRLNSSVADLSREKGGNMKFFSAHHTFETLMPSKIYFENHPEYYAYINGERKNTQLCLSNDDVLKIVCENLFKQIEENPHCKVFSVAQNDNEQYCQCEKCRKIDDAEGSPSGSMINFVNKVADKVKEKYPDILIHTFAYQYTKKAPKHIKPRENIIVRLCNIECEWSMPFLEKAQLYPDSKEADFINNIKDWTSISDNVYIWDYAVNFSNYLQFFPCYYQMAENIKLYKKLGVKGVLQQGNFSYGAAANMEELKSYLISRLLWNANENPDEIIDEFLEGVYGNGAQYIKEYLLLTTKAVKGHSLGIYNYPESPYITDELLEKCEELFKKAMLNAENDEVKQRIEKESLAIEYLKVARCEDDKEREKRVDVFKEKVKKFKLTEIMERINLELSFEIMKNSRFARNREDKYSMYYVVK